MIVVYDACVLYPAPLRSLLMYLALTDVFLARWTDMIHEEWMRALSADRPDMPRARLERVRDLMNAHVPDCLVTGFESLIPELGLPDPGDRHVLAAAIHCGAGVIVTKNLTDFPAEMLTRWRIEAMHPDDFVLHLVELAPAAVCAAARNQRESLRNPPMSLDEYLSCLQRQSLPQTVKALREFAHLI